VTSERHSIDSWLPFLNHVLRLLICSGKHSLSLSLSLSLSHTHTHIHTHTHTHTHTHMHTHTIPHNRLLHRCVGCGSQCDRSQLPSVHLGCLCKCRSPDAPTPQLHSCHSWELAFEASSLRMARALVRHSHKDSTETYLPGNCVPRAASGQLPVGAQLFHSSIFPWAWSSHQ
jgi:hypothetical protein